MAKALHEAVCGALLQQCFSRHEFMVRRRVPGTGGGRRVEMRLPQLTLLQAERVLALAAAAVDSSEELGANMLWMCYDHRKAVW